MAMFKVADFLADDLVVSLPDEGVGSDNEVVFYAEEPEASEVIEMHTPEQPGLEISFKLPFLPGAPDELLEVSGDQFSDEEVKEDKKDQDKSKAADQPKDLNWIKQYLDNIPKHRGETLGLERAKSYLGRGGNLLSKIIQDDHEGKIDISHAEDARIEIENGIERLEKELAKRKKKASQANDMTKSASSIGGFMVTVPLKISRIARVCINAVVSAGKDMEDMVIKQSAKWKLSDDEQADLVQLIQDMGYYIKRDRGFMINDKDPYVSTSTDNFDYAANYQA